MDPIKPELNGKDLSEIKDLIGRSVLQVDALLSQVASGAHEQSQGIRQVSQVSQAVQDPDRMTQQNAALVEPTAAAAASVKEHADSLAGEVRRFKIPT
jgi:methyl-accepting chemotaxis protein